MHSKAASTILHIDDKEANRYVIRRILEREGYKVLEAATGETGLQMTRTESPDLVILDVKLPRMNGFEVCQRIKSDPGLRYTPVLHLSSYYNRVEDKAHGLQEGADAYLISPIEPIELVATVRALLRVKHAEQALAESMRKEQDARHEAEKLYEEAKQANKIKDEFLATLSHELRTPLAAILGHAELLLAGNCLNDDYRNSLEVICRNAKAQSELIDDLLDISRITSGKLLVERLEVDLCSVLKSAIQVVELAASVKQIQIHTEFAAERVVVSGDQARLQQVFWNLLSNAVKFTERGGSVHVKLAAIGSNVAVSVTDSGMGIAPNFLPHVFERFRQENASTTKTHGGLGLGLAICKHLVELHGGMIEVESEGLGRGATFTVRLPMALDLPLVQTPVPTLHTGEDVLSQVQSLRRLDATKPLSNYHIVVIDDSEDTCTLTAKILERVGAHIEKFSSVKSAISYLTETKQWPNLCICDIAMPDEDGYSFIRKLRKLDINGETLPAIALTAYARLEDSIAARQNGFNAHLAKPVMPSKLVATILNLTQ
ncbi:response regulator [Oligoflexus tunisiensis]|uniref:response regulator n=1 Tax=Oligoflexus tunisiensis TaxID=708132 RepID=UPI000A95796E|nr:response regulator [Oligoflexus tunisiensis]